MHPSLWIAVAAQLLDKDEQSQADWRSATHAAYYAVYHTAVAFFRLDPTRSKVGHSDIQDLLLGLNLTPNVPKHIVAARRVYRELKQLRVQADYYLSKEFSVDSADRALQLAQMVVQPYTKSA